LYPNAVIVLLLASGWIALLMFAIGSTGRRCNTFVFGAFLMFFGLELIYIQVVSILEDLGITQARQNVWIVSGRAIAEELLRMALLCVIVTRLDLRTHHFYPSALLGSWMAMWENLHLYLSLYGAAAIYFMVTGQATIDFDASHPSVRILALDPWLATLGASGGLVRLALHVGMAYVGIHALLNGKYFAACAVALIHAGHNFCAALLMHYSGLHPVDVITYAPLLHLSALVCVLLVGWSVGAHRSLANVLSLQRQVAAPAA
jgi:hypothetical protein